LTVRAESLAAGFANGDDRCPSLEPTGTQQVIFSATLPRFVLTIDSKGSRSSWERSNKFFAFHFPSAAFSPVLFP
jgi:hypothetical protein